ncbi:MAG: hypothetical protein GEV03_15955 [Streptosporangiales bacterium]|nr:hypothetical protein [Streptosporangiales bacterium]
MADGQIVVTRFDCPTYRSLLAVLMLHARLKIEVRRKAGGFVGVKLLIDFRRRTVLSISLWKDLDSVYSMGQVPGHIEATRIPRGFGINTNCGVFCFVGDWRRVMFGSPVRQRSPLQFVEERKDGSS